MQPIKNEKKKKQQQQKKSSLKQVLRNVFWMYSEYISKNLF